MARFCSFPPSSLLWGGRGIIVPFYSVQDCRLKPGSHLCDKHNTSEISISISTRKKEHVFLVLMLMSLVLCLSHKWEPGLRLRSFGMIRIRISDPRSVWIMVHQRNRRIHSLKHHEPDRSWITHPDPDHPKGTQPKLSFPRQESISGASIM